MSVEDVIYIYMEYLYSISPSASLKSIIEGRGIDNETLVVIAEMECEEVRRESPGKKVMSLRELSDELVILGREKSIDVILDR